MPDRAEEVAHLLQADERIAEARGRLQLMERLIREAQDVGVPPRALVLSSLDTMNGTLHAMLQHRALIAQTIAAIDAGLLPSTKAGKAQREGAGIKPSSSGP